MKKVTSIFLALVLVLSLGTVAFAATDDGNTYTDMSTVTLSKEYKLTNSGTISPAETFSFSTLTCTGVEDAGVGVTKDNAPVPTIASVSYTAGEAGSNTAKKDITITLPSYSAVGVYTYTFTEVEGVTAGVTYRSDAIKLVVTVIEQNGKVRVAAVHTEGENEEKSDDFDNTYSAGSLSVTKQVTGNMGDQQKEFTVKVTFTAPTGETVKSDITYVDGTETKTISAGEGWTGSKEVEITLKHNETVTFNNIPYGVTYAVVENDYTAEADGKYDPASYDSNREGTISADSISTTITNNKGANVDTGIFMDSLPYVMLLAVALVGLAVFFAKKRNAYER